MGGKYAHACSGWCSWDWPCLCRHGLMLHHAPLAPSAPPPARRGATDEAFHCMRLTVPLLAKACAMQARASLALMQSAAQTAAAQGVLRDARRPLSTLNTFATMLVPRLKEGEPERDMAKTMLLQVRPRPRPGPGLEQAGPRSVLRHACENGRALEVKQGLQACARGCGRRMQGRAHHMRAHTQTRRCRNKRNPPSQTTLGQHHHTSWKSQPALPAIAGHAKAPTVAFHASCVCMYVRVCVRVGVRV